MDSIGLVEGEGQVEHVELITKSLMSVTAPVLASSLPFTVAPALRVILAVASMLPTKVVVDPIVAEEPTTQ